jgi:hypothetical protein
VVADSLELRNRQLLVAANRYLPFFGDNANSKLSARNFEPFETNIVK